MEQHFVKIAKSMLACACGTAIYTSETTVSVDTATTGCLSCAKCPADTSQCGVAEQCSICQRRIYAATKKIVNEKTIYGKLRPLPKIGIKILLALHTMHPDAYRLIPDLQIRKLAERCNCTYNAVT